MTWGQQNSEADAHEQLDYAVAEGVNFFDTAELYPVPPEPEKQGRTEQYISSWLKKRSRRDDLIIASKVAGPSSIISSREKRGDGETNLDRESIRAAIDGSLERLGTDYIDIYQVHWPERTTNFFGRRGYATYEPEPEVSIEETLGALAELVEEGKIRYIGVSNETPWGVAEYLRVAVAQNLPRIVSIQNQYSLLNRTYEIGLSEFAHRENVPLLAYSPLSMGVLTGKYLDGAKPEGARFTLYGRNEARYNPPHAQAAVRAYVDLAKKHGLDPAQMALAFVNTRDFVASNIIGATTMEQLKTDIASIDIELSKEVLAEIDELYTSMPDPTC